MTAARMFQGRTAGADIPEGCKTRGEHAAVGAVPLLKEQCLRPYCVWWLIDIDIGFCPLVEW